MGIGASCGGCGAQWSGVSAAHCGGCHETFAGVGLFDEHRSQHGERGACRRPAEVMKANGERVLWLRDGMWRGPEMDDATKRVAFGRR
jgi:hypothetical protein